MNELNEHQARIALADIDDTYKTLLESTNAIPWKIHWDSMRFSYIGPQIEALLGWPQNSWLTAQDWIDRIHPEDRDKTVNFCVSQSVAGVDHEADYRALTMDGDYVWIRDVVHVIRKDGATTELVGFMFDISERKKMEEELTESHRRLREVEQRELLSQERSRLMQDMHDGLGYSLVTALRLVENGKLDKSDVVQLLKSCIDDLKLAIDSMEPVEADLLLLLATLRFRLEHRLEAAGIKLFWEVQDIPELDWLNQRNSLHILRILQEAFTNIIKHTSASEVRVKTVAADEGVLVTISDNGPGFDIDQARLKGGKGMGNLMSRAKSIGGRVSWLSSDKGTQFLLMLPLSLAMPIEV